MTRKADFTSHEWTILTDTAGWVGFGMIAISRSGPIGKLREFSALSTCLSPHVIPIQFKRNELVLSLLEEYEISEVDPFSCLVDAEKGGLLKAIAAAPHRALSCCGRVANLLAEKAPWAEGDGLKRWLLWVAYTVASASGNGWLGLGRRVSYEEDVMLRRLASALRVSAVAAVPTPAELEKLLGLAPAETNGVHRNDDDQSATPPTMGG